MTVIGRAVWGQSGAACTGVCVFKGIGLRVAGAGMCPHLPAPALYPQGIMGEPGPPGQQGNPGPQVWLSVYPFVFLSVCASACPSAPVTCSILSARACPAPRGPWGCQGRR